MEERGHWLDLFTWETWQEFIKAGGQVSGFRESRWNTVQKISVGDYLLCYLTGISRWIGVLEVTSKPYQDDSAVWTSDPFPARVGVRIVSALEPETAVPVLDMRQHLSVFKGLRNPANWSAAFRGSPAKWTRADGEAVLRAVSRAVENPVSREFDKSKLRRRVRFAETKAGLVAIPDDERQPEEHEPLLRQEGTAHTEIQAILATMGSRMGLAIWVASNDRGRMYKGRTLGNIDGVIDELPLNFDAPTLRTVSLIDLLWLNGNAVAAAFEIESTTSIYSGLLRMSDLIAMQPNINIPLYIVAPDERRDKVIAEVNRPTFSKLEIPLNEICRFLPFSELRKKADWAGDLVKYLKPEFISEISESCIPD